MAHMYWQNRSQSKDLSILYMFSKFQKNVRDIMNNEELFSHQKIFQDDFDIYVDKHGLVFAFLWKTIFSEVIRGGSSMLGHAVYD